MSVDLRQNSIIDLTKGSLVYPSLLINSKKHLFQAEGFSLIEKYLIIFTTKIFQEMQGIIVHNTHLIYGSILQYEGSLQASMLYLQQILLCRFCFDDYDRCQIAN